MYRQSGNRMDSEVRRRCKVTCRARMWRRVGKVVDWFPEAIMRIDFLDLDSEVDIPTYHWQ